MTPFAEGLEVPFREFSKNVNLFEMAICHERTY